MGAVVRFNMYIEETYPDCPCPKIVFYPIPSHPLVNPITGELDTKNAFPGWNSNTNKLFELLRFVKRIIRQADEYILQIKDLLLGNSTKSINCPLDRARQDSEKKAMSAETISNNNSRSHKFKVRETTSHEEADSQPLEGHDSSWTIGMFNQSCRDKFTWFHHTLDFIAMYFNEPEEFRCRIDDFKQKCDEQLLERPALCGDDGNAIVFTPWNSETHEPVRSCVLAGRFTPSSLFASYHKETESVCFIPGHAPGLD